MPRIAVTPVLLGLNVAVFGLMLASGIHPMAPTIDSLVQWGANYGPKTTNGEWWRMFTAMFLHIGILHLLFNMVALWNVGSFMERVLGSTGFVVLYLLAGLLGSVASVAWNPFVVSAGASGAIFGLYGGLLAFLVRHRDTTSQASLAALRSNTLVFVGYNLLYGFVQEGIDMAAHLGGLAGGFLCGFVLTQPRSQAGRARHHVRSALVGLIGLLLIGEIVTLLPRVEDVQATLQHFSSFDTTTLATFNKAIAQVQQRQLTETELGRIIEQDVLPPWRAQRETLLRLQSQRRLPQRQQRLVSTLMEYMTARQEGWELLKEGLRTHDPRALKSANEKQRQADQVLGQLGSVRNK
jgi:rhomboid protease GluP